MKIRSLRFFTIAALLAGQLCAAGENNLDKARSITSICSLGEIANMKKVDWEPLNENDLQYTGPVDDVYWANFAENPGEAEVSSERDLARVVQGMCFGQISRLKLELQGPSPDDVQ